MASAGVSEPNRNFCEGEEAQKPTSLSTVTRGRSSPWDVDCCGPGAGQPAAPPLRAELLRPGLS